MYTPGVEVPEHQHRVRIVLTRDFSEPIVCSTFERLINIRVHEKTSVLELGEVVVEFCRFDKVIGGFPQIPLDLSTVKVKLSKVD